MAGGLISASYRNLSCAEQKYSPVTENMYNCTKKGNSSVEI